MFSKASLALYLIVDPTIATGDILATTQLAVDNGVTCVQLRWKNATDREILDLASRLLAVTEPARLPLIINDRIDIALAAGAQGVHLGVDDLPVEASRRLAGDEFIIGYSPETDDQIESAEDRGASYLGIGPFFGTATKLDAGTPLGAAEFTRRRRLTALPVVAIGGITPSNASEPALAGSDGIAVASAILRSDDPAESTRSLSRSVRSRAS